MEVRDIIPDLLNREETLALGGVARPYTEEEESARIRNEVLSVDGIYVTPSEAPIAYGDKTCQQVLEELRTRPQQRIYLYGGWSNGMTLWVNIIQASLPETLALNQIKVKDIKTGLQASDRPPIFYDYRSDFDSLSGWKDMVRQKGLQLSPQEYEELTLADLLLKVGGAPTRWTLMVTVTGKDEPLCPPTTSVPFPGSQYGNGFIACYLKPVFKQGVFEKPICNTTGSRAVDSIALANLLVRLRHDPKTAIEVYIEDARRRREQMLKRGGKAPYTVEEAERYAASFVESQEPIVEEIRQILSRYEKREIEGFQYAVNIISHKSLPIAVYKIPSVRPYCFVKKRGWEVAVEK